MGWPDTRVAVDANKAAMIHRVVNTAVGSEVGRLGRGRFWEDVGIDFDRRRGVPAS